MDVLHWRQVGGVWWEKKFGPVGAVVDAVVEETFESRDCRCGEVRGCSVGLHNPRRVIFCVVEHLLNVADERRENFLAVDLAVDTQPGVGEDGSGDAMHGKRKINMLVEVVAQFGERWDVFVSVEVDGVIMAVGSVRVVDVGGVGPDDRVKFAGGSVGEEFAPPLSGLQSRSVECAFVRPTTVDVAFAGEEVADPGSTDLACWMVLIPVDDGAADRHMSQTGAVDVSTTRVADNEADESGASCC